MTQLAQHSSLTAEAYTPALIVEPARYTLGGIDLDPASCPLGQEVVKATQTLNDDGQWGGLGLSWYGRVFLNPPGGKLHKQTLLPFKAGGKGNSATNCVSAAAVWWAKLYAEWLLGNVDSAICVCFSMAIFRTSQDFADVQAVYEFPFCVPHERVNYDCATADGRREPTKGAPADSAIILLPPKKELAHPGPVMARFIEAFAPLGKVRI